MKGLRIFLALLILVVLFIFSASNAQPVQVFFWDYRTAPLPLFLVLILLFVLGFVLAALFGAFRASRLRRQISQLRREVETLRQAIPPRRGPPSA